MCESSSALWRPSANLSADRLRARPSIRTCPDADQPALLPSFDYMSPRTFRGPESLRHERATRDMVVRFLRDQAWTEITDAREHNGQTIRATLPTGTPVVARVKLCWRRGADGRNQERHANYSATQLLARIKDGDWIGSLSAKVAREEARGTTHLLLVQRDGESISLAALIPLESVIDIWTRQRDLSQELIRAGMVGRRQKNHAMNGHSPTLWLEDGRGGQAVAEALWNWPGVIDLSRDGANEADDTLPEAVLHAERYVEGAVKTVTVNAYERNRRSRQACIAHHGTRCVVCGFSFADTYGDIAVGHIHVHHVRPIAAAGGPYLVDPINDLRPVCANCHSIIHLGGVCRSLEEVKALLKPASQLT